MEAPPVPLTPVDGVAGFGIQCPYGTISHPNAARLEAWNCSLGLERLQLEQNIQPLFLQADCKKKLLSVRMDNRVLDTMWEVMPDGSFFITLEPGMIQFRSDGPGRSSCFSPATLDLMGKLECSDRDKVKIKFESIWWLGKTRNAALLQRPDTCRIPEGCYLYSQAQAQQCQ